MKEISGFEGLYKVDKLGNVYSIKSGRKLRQVNNAGYLRLSLCKKSSTKIFRVHRIVATAFIDNPFNKKFVNHKNGIKNDNRLENLEWVTAKENMIHAFKVLKIKAGHLGHLGLLHPTSKRIGQYKDNKMVNIYGSIRECQRITGFKNQNISAAANGIYKQAYGYQWKFIS